MGGGNRGCSFSPVPRLSFGFRRPQPEASRVQTMWPPSPRDDSGICRILALQHTLAKMSTHGSATNPMTRPEQTTDKRSVPRSRTHQKASAPLDAAFPHISDASSMSHNVQSANSATTDAPLQAQNHSPRFGVQRPPRAVIAATSTLNIRACETVCRQHPSASLAAFCAPWPPGVLQDRDV